MANPSQHPSQRLFVAGVVTTTVGLGLVLGLVSARLATPPAHADYGANDPSSSTYGDDTTDFVVPYDGYLMVDSTPLSGNYTLGFSLYERDTATGAISTTAEWTETQTVTLFDGRFSVGLGASTSLTDDLLDGDALYLQISVEDPDTGAMVPLGGHQQIEPVPYAIWSAHAADFDIAGVATVGGSMSLTGSLAADTLASNTAGLLTVDAAVEADSLSAATLTAQDRVDVGGKMTAALVDLDTGSGLASIKSTGSIAIATDTDDNTADGQIVFQVGAGATLASVDSYLRAYKTGAVAFDEDLDVVGTLDVRDLTTNGNLTIGRDLVGLEIETPVSLQVENNTGVVDTNLGSTTDRVCFLQDMNNHDLDSQHEFRDCRVYISGTQWKLEVREGQADAFGLDPYGASFSFSSNNIGGRARCTAQCLKLPLAE